MRKTPMIIFCVAVLSAVTLSCQVLAQPPGGGGGRGGRDGGGRGGRGGGPGGPGGFMAQMMQSLPVMAALDADKDGVISTAEIENAVAALKGLDKNKDGKLTEEELRPEFPRGGPGGPGGFGGPGGGFGGPGRGGDPEQIADRFFEQDKNGDKKLSKDEISPRMESLFARADADKDDVVTRDELITMLKQQEAEGGRGGRGGFGGGRRGGGGGGPGGDRPERPSRPE